MHFFLRACSSPASIYRAASPRDADGCLQGDEDRERERGTSNLTLSYCKTLHTTRNSCILRLYASNCGAQPWQGCTALTWNAFSRDKSRDLSFCAPLCERGFSLSSLCLLLLSSASRISRSQSRRRETYFPIYIPIIHPLSLSLSFSLLLSDRLTILPLSSPFPLPASCKVSRPILALVCKYTTEWNLARPRGKVKIKTFRVRFEREWLPFFFSAEISFTFIGGF